MNFLLSSFNNLLILFSKEDSVWTPGILGEMFESFILLKPNGVVASFCSSSNSGRERFDFFQ